MAAVVNSKSWAGKLLEGFLRLTIVGGLIQSQYKKQQQKMRDAYNASLKDRYVMTAMADGARRFVLGECRVAGDVVYKAVTGGKSEYYTLVVVFAGHEVQSIDQIYVGDVPVTVVSGAVQTEPWGDRLERTQVQYTSTPATTTLTTINFGRSDVESVSVTSLGPDGKRVAAVITGQTSSSVSFVSVPGTVYTADYTCLKQYSFMLMTKFLGGAGQDLHALVRSPTSGVTDAQIADTDQFKGMAGVVLLCSYDPTAFPGGVPAVSAVVKGAKVHDPRLGYAQWSDNPALCARWVALHPNLGGCDEAEIDDASFVAAANACDTSHTYTDSAGNATTTRLYRCGYSGRFDSGAESHFAELVEAMGGKHGWSGGRLRVRAGVYSAPAPVTIDESWLSGGVSVSRGADLSELVNIFKPSIADRAQNWDVLPLPDLRIEEYITADGEELPSEISMTAINFAPQARHICGILARDQRWGRTYRLPCNLKAYPLELFDVVRLSLSRYNAVSKPVEVLERSIDAEGRITLLLKETDASIYQPDAVFAVDIPSSNGQLTKPWFVPDIEISSVESGTDTLLIQADGSLVTRAVVSYPAVTETSVLVGGFIDVAYTVSGSGEWATVRVSGDDPTVSLTGLRDGELYLIRMRLASRLATGKWSQTVEHRVVGKTEPPSAVTGLSLTIVPGGVRVTWDSCPDPDYAATEIRLGSVWSDVTTPAFDGRAQSYVIQWPALGSLTVQAKHRDTTGNKSATAASASITVTSDVFVGTAQLGVNAVTNGAVTTNPDTEGNNGGAAISVVSGFLVGPTVTLASGDQVDMTIIGVHDQALWFNAGFADVEVWIEKGLFSGDVVSTVSKFVQPWNDSSIRTNIPLYCGATVAPGAGSHQFVLMYTIRCRATGGSLLSALKDFVARAEWRYRRVKR